MDSIEAPRYKKFKNEIYDREQMIKLLDLAKKYRNGITY